MNIYLSKNNERQGPFPIKQVGEMVKNGEYMMSDLAWHEGMSEWQPIHKIIDVADQIIPAIPVIETSIRQISTTQLGDQAQSDSAPIPDSHGQSGNIHLPTSGKGKEDKLDNPNPHNEQEKQAKELEWEGTKKILQGVGLIILAALLLVFMISLSNSHDDLPTRPWDLPHNNVRFLPQQHNLFGSHAPMVSSALAHAIEKQLPALSRSWRINHSLGWIIVICLFVLGICKIVDGVKIIDSAKDKRPNGE